jgi:hypothetical protein
MAALQGAVPDDKYCINCWSLPRCCSTSLMYSFAQRSDTQVQDQSVACVSIRITACCPSNTGLAAAYTSCLDRAVGWLQVLDEPLYANYLRLTGMQRPYRDQASAWGCVVAAWWPGAPQADASGGDASGASTGCATQALARGCAADDTSSHTAERSSAPCLCCWAGLSVSAHAGAGRPGE